MPDRELKKEEWGKKCLGNPARPFPIVTLTRISNLKIDRWDQHKRCRKYEAVFDLQACDKGILNMN